MSNRLDDLPDILTAKEVANFMRVDVRTVRTWVDEGQLAIIPIGKREYRIARAALIEFLQTYQQKRDGGEEQDQ